MAKKYKDLTKQEIKEKQSERINSALAHFAEIIISRMEVMKDSNWKMGWLSGKSKIGLPQNVTGRVYTGSNAFLCKLHTATKGYKSPVYLTIKQIKDLGAFPKKGEKSIPIFKWGVLYYDRETGKKVTSEEVEKTPQDERDKKFKPVPFLKFFNEWNVDQTTLEEVNKEKYDELVSRFETYYVEDSEGMYKNEAIDELLSSQSWVCPINYKDRYPQAVYNKTKDEIFIPRKDQFKISSTPEEIYKDGMEYYSTLIHEMTHSTGHPDRLDRIKAGASFGDNDYAKEELVAELTAAIVGSSMGFDNRIQENNIAYLQSWTKSLKEEPKFLLSIMKDVNKASSMVLEHIDAERVKLGQKALLEGNLDGEEEREKNEKEMQEIVNDATQEKEPLPSLRESGNDMVLEGIISAAEDDENHPLHKVSNFQDFKKTFASVTDVDQLKPVYVNTDDEKMALLKAQVATISQKELLEVGANKLPYYHYSHKEGRTLYDIEKSFERIEKIGKANPGNEQIQKRVEQARSIFNRYEHNVTDDLSMDEIIDNDWKEDTVFSRYTYIEGLLPLEERQQNQEEFDSLDNDRKAIRLKTGEVLPVRYNIDNNMMEAGRDVDGNFEVVLSKKYNRNTEAVFNMEEFALNLAVEDAKAANMPVSLENKTPSQNSELGDSREKIALIWSRLNNQIKHPSGETLIVDYDKEKDTIDAFIMSEEGKQKVYSTNYGRDEFDSISGNYDRVKKELLSMEQFQEKKPDGEVLETATESEQVSTEENTLSGKEYFTRLMSSITDGEHEGHSALEIKNISELRNYFKDNSHVNEWMEGVSNRELIEAGADKLPNIRYSHKEGRTLYDMEAAYSNINAKYEDVSDDRTRQIAHRIDQAKSIITAYHTNIENVHGENYLFDKESAHKIIPRAEYTASVSQGQAVAASESSNDDSYCYSFARFESSERTKAFDNHRENGDNEALLHLAEIMDINENIEVYKIRKDAQKTPDDKVLADNSFYAVVFNQQNGSYELMRKVEKDKVLDLVKKSPSYAVAECSIEVKKLAYEDAAQKMGEFAQREPNYLTMPNREVLGFQYNAESNQLEIGKNTPEGLDVQYTFDYDLSSSPEHNLSIAHDDLVHLDEFRLLSEEEIELREKTALRWRTTDNKLELPSGDVLTVVYDQKKDTLNVAYTTEDGKPKVFSTKYNHEGSATKNVGDLWQFFSNMKQYQSNQEASPEKENKEKDSATQEKKGEVYYFSYAYLQSTDDTQDFDDLQKKGDYKQILQLAQMYDQGDALEQSNTFKNAKKFTGDDVLEEDGNYAVVYNNAVGGTYDLMRKVTKEEILDAIERYGLDSDASEDVKKIAYEDVAKKFSDIKSRTPAFTMPNNDVVYFQYNQEKNVIEAGFVTNNGLKPEYTFDYDVDKTLDSNLENVYEQLSEMDEFQAQEEKEEEAESLDEDTQLDVPREDSNIETDVAGVAKQFAAEGMPMSEAEQKAKAIAEAQQHQEYHEEKDLEASEEKAQQKEQEEKEKEEKAKAENEAKAKNNPKIGTHAALLATALGAASANGGIWMNKAQRSQAEFIHSKVPVTAYNNIMMTLNSDANKYKTNVYTYYNTAKENDMPVQKNQEAFTFHWTKWGYQNAMNHDDIIDQKAYDALPADEKSFYAKHAVRVEQKIYNVDQTVMRAKNFEAYGELVKDKGEFKEKEKAVETSVYKNYREVQKKNANVILLLRDKDSYVVYGKNAKKIADIISAKTEKKTIDGNTVPYVSFNHYKLDTVLPKIISANCKVAICDKIDDKRAIETKLSNKDIISKAHSTAKAVAKQSGMDYERVMVVQDAAYDKENDKIVVSGMSADITNENFASLYQANDVYRAVVASVGTENRLDRSGRNSFLPEDDAKHEKLVQELAAGVLMARQGLPAVLSKDNEKLVPYWQRELKENPKLIGVIERDVNNAVETIDNLVAKRKVNYEAIRGQLPEKILTLNPQRFTIASDLAKLPSEETKEVVIVKDVANKKADIILPAGASLEVNNEIPGMNKNRFVIALKKQGITDVTFYNAGGSLGLNKPNTYFKDKEVTVSRLKQYELITNRTPDVAEAASNEMTRFEKFEALPDNDKKYAFYIKAEGQRGFAVYPTKEHLNIFYNVNNTVKEKTVHQSLAQTYYNLAMQHPDLQKDIITPPKVNLGNTTIEKVCITSSRENPKQKVMFATVNGQRRQTPITKVQWNKMWLAEDMNAYKKGLAAFVFGISVNREVGQANKQKVNQAENQDNKEAKSPEKKPDETEQKPHRGVSR